MTLAYRIKAFFSIISYFIFRNRLTRVVFWLAVFLNAASWVLMAMLMQTGQDILILHYNSYLGIDLMIRIFSKRQYIELFIPSIVAMILMILNLLFSVAICFQSENKLLRALVNRQRIDDRVLTVIDKMNLLSANVLIVISALIQAMIFVYAITINLVNS